MYTLNKIVGYLISPVGFSLALVIVAAVARMIGRRRLAGWGVVLALANFWLWTTPWMTGMLGVPLEAEFLSGGRVPTVEALPTVDAIVLHGGSMGIDTNVSSYAEMWTSADRVWHAARVRKAGKAPVIYVLGGSVKLTTGGLLQDLGVPTNAVVFVEEPRNTEEEAKVVGKVSGGKGQVAGTGLETCNQKPETTRPKVLVVTSAWHMKRTMLMYEKFAPGVEAVPAPCDFENTVLTTDKSLGASLVPDPMAFLCNSTAFHEWLGYWGYKWLR